MRLGETGQLYIFGFQKLLLSIKLHFPLGTTHSTFLLYLTLFIGCICVLASPVQAQDKPVDSRVWSVKMEGNKTFDSIVLKDHISNEAPSPLKKLKFWKKVGMKLKENEVRRDVIRLERFYLRRGFDDVKVAYRIEDLSKEWRKAVVFTIAEKLPIRVEKVEFVVRSSSEDSTLIYEDDRFSSIKNHLPYRKGQRYETIKQSEVEASLVGALHNLGYPYATSAVKAQIDSAAKIADVTLISTPGPRARFDSIQVEGEENLEAKYIIRETGIKQGQLYSDKKLREAQREVFSHHMLRFALISIPDQPEDSTINIKIKVKEAPLRSVQLRAGIGNLTRIDDGFADFYKLFRGQVSWTHRSVWGRGQRFTVSGHASAINQRLATDYLFPYLINTKTSFIVSPFIEHKLEPSYEIFRGGLNNSLVYQYSSNFTGTAAYEFTVNNEYTKNAQESLPDTIDSYNVSSFNLNIFYSKGLRRGQKGWSFQPFWQVSGLLGESTYSFQKAGIDVRKFTPLTDNIVFAKRISLAGIYYAKQDSLPADIRIYNGGTNSVRGWNRYELGPKRAILNENGDFDRYVPTGGRATFSFNTEFRFQLDQIFKGFGAATFLDGGQVWRRFGDIGTTPILFGVGGGLRYQSPIGPIRVDLAYKINPTKQDLRMYKGQNYGRAWDHWGIHFSIGQAF